MNGQLSAIDFTWRRSFIKCDT